LPARKLIRDLVEFAGELTQVGATCDTAVPAEVLETCLRICAELGKVHQFFA
jgi:hypothetical protein